MPRHVALLSLRLLGPLEVAVAGRPIVVDTRKCRTNLGRSGGRIAQRDSRLGTTSHPAALPT